ncbi:hypothetical protein AB0H51_09875 [Streptomyces griseoluteus]|uniref:hypothetical protein n=1 Tax=Streptomyces griseoluteus TaxID=29306 RepID=UPI003405C65C
MRTAALVHFAGIAPALSAPCRELVTRALSVPAGRLGQDSSSVLPAAAMTAAVSATSGRADLRAPASPRDLRMSTT